MKFKLDKVNKVIELMGDEEIKDLKNLGFKFVESARGHTYLEAENASIEIDTIDDLLTFAKKWGRKIIIEDKEITIYDDYIE